ncbi:Non-hemolytic phospholipase C [Paraburkholderia aspalathi]|uniref:Non-hemolytic phospholipase C n=1 Tax=Paraburkholderia aspalathi TaxID=1324617 RepID=A0ABN7NG76_9BURK|nr:Non-hemolytic phospholipase C [Paraburkholderia aspalathi]
MLIEKAIAIAPNNPTGTGSLADIEHVIIFMQENRSFDYYFGSLSGVRGFGDPRPTPIPSGNYVWYQPEGVNPSTRGFAEHVTESWVSTQSDWYQTDRPTQSSHYVLPFRLNSPGGNVNYQGLGCLDHGWKQSQNLWQNWDVWVPLKSRQSMGFLNSDDLPFYYSLANAFAICDDYHCSVFSATDPNRFYLWSGTCPPPMNFPDHYTNGGYVADIAEDNNSKITPAMHGQSDLARSTAIGAGVADWETYAERLTNNAITWKIYQERDNYGDNYLEYFKNFRIDDAGTKIDQSNIPYFKTLYQRGRVFATGFAEVGDAIIAAFAADVAAGMEPDSPAAGTIKAGLPRVSWIVAPAGFCEHPTASPGAGESFTARLMDVLVNKNPNVFSKTVFMLMYDENDGDFDHVPSPVPPISAEYGQMTMADAGSAENYSSIPVGLGPRVPMLVISPWTAGGKVSSQTCDHTSVLRFLEQWLTAKGLASSAANRCALISDWRRTVCGDLTELFDFSQSRAAGTLNTTTTFKNGSNSATVPATQAFPAFPAPTTRIAAPLGYEFFVQGQLAGERFSLHITNTGKVGIALMAYWMPMSDAQTTFHYTVEAGKSLTASPAAPGSDGSYDWAVHGPNGFLREFRGNLKNVSHLGQAPEVAVCYDVASGNIQLTLDNRGSTKATVFQISDNAYYQNKPVQVTVAGGSEQTLMWSGSADSHNGAPICSGWHDVSIRVAGDPSFLRRVAGCVQPKSGPLKTDPAIGNPAMFKPTFSFQPAASGTLRIDYVTPPWNHRPLNWFGVFKASDTPAASNVLLKVGAPRGVGSIIASTVALPVGQYNLFYFFDNSFTTIAGPVAFSV